MTDETCRCCHKVQFEYMDKPRYECWGVSPDSGIVLCDEGSMSCPKTRSEKIMTEENPVEHYDFDGLSPFDVFKVLQETDSDMTHMESFFRFNAIKYLWRYKHKNGVEDLKKAQDYIRLLINEVEND